MLIVLLVMLDSKSLYHVVNGSQCGSLHALPRNVTAGGDRCRTAFGDAPPSSQSGFEAAVRLSMSLKVSSDTHERVASALPPGHRGARNVEQRVYSPQRSLLAAA